MTKETKSRVTVGAILGGAVILTAVLTLSGFETQKSHDKDIEGLRTEQQQAAERQELAHQKEYDRLICIAEGIQSQLDGKRPQVCR